MQIILLLFMFVLGDIILYYSDVYLCVFGVAVLCPLRHQSHEL